MYDKKSGRIYLMLFVICCAFLVASVTSSTLHTLIPNFVRLNTSSQRLYTDSFLVGGVNGTLLNAAVLGYIALATLVLAGVKPNGLTVAIVLLLVGFGFSGITVIAVFPIIFGVWVFAKITKTRYKKYSHESLLAFSLTPIVNQLAFGNTKAFGDKGQLVLAIFIGFLIGLTVAPLMNYFTTKTRRYKLQYELGALGIISMIYYASYKAIIIDRTQEVNFAILRTRLSQGSNLWFILVAIFVCFILFAFFINKSAKDDYIKDIFNKELIDYTDEFKFSSILINIGVVGILGLIYFAVIGTNFNGISISALFVCIAISSTKLNPIHIPVVVIGFLASAYTSLNVLTEPIMLLGFSFSLGIASMISRSNIYFALASAFIFNYINIFSQSIFAGLNLYASGSAMGFTVFVFNNLYKAIFENDNLKENNKIKNGTN